jgi:hydrogenase nickel incorporation protein HypB
MCAVCGCGSGEVRISGGTAHAHEHDHVAPDGTVTRHSHAHDHPHAHAPGEDAPHHHHHDEGGEHEHVGADGRVYRHSHAHAAGDAHVHMAAGTPNLVRIEQDILAKNDRFAAVNRRLFEATGVLCLNLMSSPGSGKTTLLERTLTDTSGRFPAAVIEGDQQTSADAERIRATGTPAIQVNTGKGCHLDAQMVTQAVGELPLPQGAVLFVENVGNLVCPAGFDLGEAARAVVVSVTEGEDKPLKYPNMFASADVVLVNKIDLLPHLRFDLARLIENARKVKPGVAVLEVSATSGQGLDAWYAWIEARRASPSGG